MILESFTIENYKSIKYLDFNINKLDSSYTRIIVGINESGKSNLLEALSYINKPEEPADYLRIHSNKDENNNPITLSFKLQFRKSEDYNNVFRANIDYQGTIDFQINNIVKKVFLRKEDSFFQEDYEFDIQLKSKGQFIKTESLALPDGSTKENRSITEQETDQPLTGESLKEAFKNSIIDTIKTYEPQALLWKPSDEFLLSEVDLNEFKNNINSNIPLRNIFALVGLKSEEQIQSKIDDIKNITERRKLQENLNEKARDYVNKIWKHEIIPDIEIDSTGKISIHIKDGGKENRTTFIKMIDRSDGFKQFISLILSLSIETRKLGNQDRLILIDEPENHLHPSGIRDLRTELIKMGKQNYIFASTHSPFLIDRKTKERNIIILKNHNAQTEKRDIKNEEDILDDEVLRMAFGLDVYKDLLSPKRILVEGQTDKIILQKAFKRLGIDCAITNGCGSNIVTTAAKLNDDSIEMITILDDDDDGQNDKQAILSIGNIFNKSNVFTLKDLQPEIFSNATIEDLLDVEFVKGKFIELHNKEFPNKDIDINYTTGPIIKQIKIYLQQKNLYTEEIMKELKTLLSEKFSPTKRTLSSKTPQLEQIALKINDMLTPSNDQ